MTRNLKATLSAGIGIAMLIVLAGMAMSIGPSSIGLAQIVQSLLLKVSSSFHGLITVNLMSWQETVIWQVRAPRVVVGVLVGAALGTSGAALQGLFRNPLASPDILGVASGAELGASIAIFLGLSTANVWALPGFAILGACITLALVYGIAMRGGQAPIATLLLVGVAMSALTLAMLSFVLALALQQWELGEAIVSWTLGNLEGRSWDHVRLLLPVFLVCFTIIASHARELDILLVGEIHAVSVGVDVPRVRLWLLASAAILTGTATAVAGGIGFIGLVVPHIMRLLVGPNHRHLLPLSALCGALTLIGADLFVRTPAFSASAIPVGSLTAMLGAPFFIYLLIRQKNALNL